MNKKYNKYKGDDLDFYEQIVLNKTKEEKKEFLKNHPDFLKDYPINPMKEEQFDLLDDNLYRGIMRRIKLLN